MDSLKYVIRTLAIISILFGLYVGSYFVPAVLKTTTPSKGAVSEADKLEPIKYYSFAESYLTYCKSQGNQCPKAVSQRYHLLKEQLQFFGIREQKIKLEDTRILIYEPKFDATIIYYLYKDEPFQVKVQIESPKKHESRLIRL
jgi:hypothetical protein